MKAGRAARTIYGERRMVVATLMPGTWTPIAWEDGPAGYSQGSLSIYAEALPRGGVAMHSMRRAS